MKIGFIGLGRMGLPMAEALLRAGHELTVHNRSQAAVSTLQARGATSRNSAAEVAGQVDVLITCLVFPDQTEQIYLGAEGAIANCRPGQIFIDTSTSDLLTTQRIGAALAVKEVAFLDAPVSGGPKGAKEGTLSIMVGGETAPFEQALPILQVMGKDIFHMGPVGAGMATKMCNQTLTATTQALAAETMVLGTKLGLDPQRLYEVLKASSGQSRALERVVPNFILARTFDPGYTVDGIIKDLECAIQTAKAKGVRLLLPTIAQQLFQEARGLGHSDKDIAAVVLAMEAIAGVTVNGRTT